MNTFVASDRAVVMTDGAWIDGKRRVDRIAAKVITFPHLPAAITLCGASTWHSLIYELVPKTFATFDELADGLSDVLREPPQPFASLPAGLLLREGVEFTLIGWSESRDRAEGYLINASDRPDGLPAWSRSEVWRAASPIHEAIDRRLAAAGVDIASEQFDPYRDGLLLMREQRRAFPEAAGGFCLATTVSRDAIASVVVERWT